MDDADDLKYMHVAIEQARRCADGPAEAPTPRVGAVVVENGGILACAYRGETGPRDHAEYAALEKKLAGRDLSTATVYTTLEPCTGERAPGKTPCAFRLISRSVRRVVIGVLDLNPNILGQGWTALHDAGISVAVIESNDLHRTIRDLSERFETHQRSRQRRSIVNAEALLVPKRRATAPIVDGSRELDVELGVASSIEAPPLATRYALGTSVWCAIRIETAGAKEVPATLLGGLRVASAGRLPNMREVVGQVPSVLLRVATIYAQKAEVSVLETVTVLLDGLPVLDLRAAGGGWVLLAEAR